MRILAVSGSLQARSSNTMLVELARSVAPPGVEVDVYESLADLPYFNPDLDRDGPPASLPDFRARVAGAYGVVIASPEYAHEMPGVLKNALDWLVGSGELYGKRVAVLCGSPRPNGGAHARDALERTLRAQGARIVVSTTVQVAKDELDAPPERIADAVRDAIGALVAPEPAGGGAAADSGG